MRLTIAHKLNLTLGGLFVIIVIVTAGTYWQLSRAERRLQELMKVAVPVSEAIHEMEVNIIGIKNGVMSYLVDMDPNHLKQILEDARNYERFHDHYLELAQTSKEKLAGAKIEEYYRELRKTADDLIRFHDEQSAAFDSLYHKYQEIDALLDEHIDSGIDRHGVTAPLRIEAALRLEINASEVVSQTSLFLHSKNTADYARMDVDVRDFQRHLAGYRALPDLTATEQILLDRVQSLFEEMLAKVRKIDGIEQHTNTGITALVRHHRALDGILDNEIRPLARKKLVDVHQQSQRSTVISGIFAVLLVIFAILLVMSVYRLLKRGITRPLAELVTAHNALARGDLDRRIEQYSGDEFGALAASFNNMAEGLQRGVDMEHRVMQSTLLRELTGLLLGARTLDEACTVIAPYAERLFPELQGGLAMISAQENQVSVVVSWGDAGILAATFQPDDCWALRRNREHVSTSPEAGSICTHFSAPATTPRLCVPMIIQEKKIGILCLGSNIPEAENLILKPDLQELAVMAAEGIGLTLFNLKLQEALRSQSIQDALTGLFNRRFFNESFAREISRAARNQNTIAVIMLDLDHFKQINDRYGHDAGDKVLELAAGLITQNTRQGDIACRYGGEEFILLLPSTSLTQAEQCAGKLLRLFHNLSIIFRDQELGRVTCSIGIAVYPEHGNSGAEVLRAADQALYAAKSRGRNRYCLP